MTQRKSLLAAGIAFVAVLALGLAGIGFAQHHDGWGHGPMWGDSDGDGFGMMGDQRGFRGDSDGDGFGMMGGGRGFGMMGDQGGYRGSMMGAYGGMMGGSYGIAGEGPVSSMDEARAAAQRFAATLDLKVGEVMQFADNYYAELEHPNGDLATEVLVDPDTGSVRIEYGPAMMWNTEYGMHTTASSGQATVSAAEAQQIADTWLAAHRDGETAGEAEAFPGYYTLHTMDGDKITGMLSVNASNGAVWYHSWHGDYVGMSES